MWEVSFGEEKGSHSLGCCPLHTRPYIACGVGPQAQAQGNGSLVSGQGLGPRTSLRLGSSRSEEVLDVRRAHSHGPQLRVSRGSTQGLLALLSVPLLVADVSDLSRFLSAFHKPHAGLIQAARQLLSDEQAPLRQKLLADLLHTVSENIAAETRDEDPPWFEGSWGVGSGRACSEPAVQGGPDPAAVPGPGPISALAALGLAFLFLNCGKVTQHKISILTSVSV